MFFYMKNNKKIEISIIIIKSVEKTGKIKPDSTL